MAKLYSLVYCLWARPGAYPIVEHLKGSSMGQIPALQADIRLSWKGLIWKNTLAYYYGRKNFYNIGPRDQSHKNLWLKTANTFCKLGHFIDINNICFTVVKRFSLQKRARKFNLKKFQLQGICVKHKSLKGCITNYHCKNFIVRGKQQRGSAIDLKE